MGDLPEALEGDPVTLTDDVAPLPLKRCGVKENAKVKEVWKGAGACASVLFTLMYVVVGSSSASSLPFFLVSLVRLTTVFKIRFVRKTEQQQTRRQLVKGWMQKRLKGNIKELEDRLKKT
jgi:hypothetical protein